MSFSDFLSTVISSTDSLLILGDFNIHICCPEKPLVKEFLDLVDSFSLMQSVLEPTHNHGHTLDLILSFGFPIYNVETADTLLSDHKPVIFNASFTASLFGNLQSCKPVGKWLRAISPSTASQFVEAYSIAETSRSTISFFGNMCTEELILWFNTTCTDILNWCAPAKMVFPKTRKQPWLNQSTRVFRQEWRRAERQWKKDNLQVSYEIVKDCMINYQHEVKVAKAQYFSDLINRHSHNPKVLFSTINSVLNPLTRTYPDPTKEVSDNFF